MLRCKEIREYEKGDIDKHRIVGLLNILLLFIRAQAGYCKK